MNRLYHLVSSFLIGLAVALAGSGSAVGYDVRVGTQAVVELFTSQGCPRCPEADSYLARLGQRDEIVTLAYHIDYWDYIGWEDTFALPANTELQKAYAASWGKSRVYTPQMVINGAHGVVGSQVEAVESALAESVLDLDIDINFADGQAAILKVGGQTGLADAIIWLVTWQEMAEVPIGRGENSGKTLRYSNIVTGRQAIGMWHPANGAELTLPLEEAIGPNDGATIIIQEKNRDLPGRIIGAAMISR